MDIRFSTVYVSVAFCGMFFFKIEYTIEKTKQYCSKKAGASLGPLKKLFSYGHFSENGHFSLFSEKRQFICDQKSSANKWTRKNVQHDELSERVAKNRVQNDVLYKKLGIFFKKSDFLKTEDLPKLMFLDTHEE